MKRQHGGILFAVALMLAVIGAMALAMSREGAMAAQSVEGEYDAAVARSLAEAGLNLAKWRNQRIGCRSRLDVAPTALAGIGSFSATVDKASSNTLDIVATGSTPSGALATVSRAKVQTHDPSKSVSKVVSSNGAQSTYIDRSFADMAVGGGTFMELSGGSSNALLRFGLGDIPADSSVTSAQLTVTQYQPSPVAAAVSVRRVLRSWDEMASTWNSAAPGAAWDHPGGDFSAAGAAAVTVGPNGSYAWDMTALVDGWASNRYPNNGFLLAADAPLQQARFYNFRAGAGQAPTLAVTYIPPC